MRRALLVLDHVDEERFVIERKIKGETAASLMVEINRNLRQESRIYFLKEASAFKTKSLFKIVV